MNFDQILDKKQFLTLLDYNRYQIITSRADFTSDMDIKDEVEKLLSEYKEFVVTKNNYIYGVKHFRRTLICSRATNAFEIACDIVADS